MLLGRDRERHEIDRVLEHARAGTSATLGLIGEPGIGKTALLDHAAERTAGMRVLRARGIQSEAQIPFASLLELLRPALSLLHRIPAPQAVALEGALALRPSPAQQRFAIGAATLSLLAAYAEPGPVAVLIDDAHLLDDSSAQALLFAFRRLVADPLAVLIAIREGEPSLLDGADLPTLRIDGLSREEAGGLLGGLTPAAAERLIGATGGNPLALIELAPDAVELEFAPEGAPVVVSARISQAFERRVGLLDEEARRALVLAAASDRGDLLVLERAARRLDLDLSSLARAESAGLLALQGGTVEFRHPLVRSAIYATAAGDRRREAHRALAAVLPDRDVDRRAWHLAAAAAGIDESASAALEQAGERARERSAYAAAAAAFERAARLTADGERRSQLVLRAADASWLAGQAEGAIILLDEACEHTADLHTQVAIDQLAGRIAVRRGPIARGCAILTMAAERADPEDAVEMLAEATAAWFAAGNPGAMRAAAATAVAKLPPDPSVRARLLSATAVGIAQILGADAAAGAEALRQAVALAESSSELRHELDLLPWLAMGPLFLREAGSGRSVLGDAVNGARARGAVGVLPFVLMLIARDQATSDRWAVAEGTYREAIELARESDQRAALSFGLAGLAWLQARRGREGETRALAAEALELCREVGAHMWEVWATAALGELALGLGDAGQAAVHFEQQRRRLQELSITDVDLSPGPELVDAYVRLGRHQEAQAITADLLAAATAKGQPWSLARAMRCRGQVSSDDVLATNFEPALRHHAETDDAFELARTRLAYGERLRRGRNRVLARDQLRAAAETFEHLDARPWAERARAELAATGMTLRRRDPTTIDELTPQELQIALLLVGGKTTREAAAALFLSPKTIEYHLRHVYQKLGINSRDALARALGARVPDASDAVQHATASVQPATSSGRPGD